MDSLSKNIWNTIFRFQYGLSYWKYVFYTHVLKDLKRLVLTCPLCTCPIQRFSVSFDRQYRCYYYYYKCKSCSNRTFHL